MKRKVDNKRKVYFLTATFNRQDLTKKSILGITKQDGFLDLDTEILVVEAGESDKTIEILKSLRGNMSM